MSVEGPGVSPTGAAFGADLGGSSKHKNEITLGYAEKGSSSTAFVRGLVGPKSRANAIRGHGVTGGDRKREMKFIF